MENTAETNPTHDPLREALARRIAANHTDPGVSEEAARVALTEIAKRNR